MDGDEEKEGDQDKGKDIEIIEPPEIADSREPGDGKVGFLVRMEFLFEGEDFFLAETEVSAAKPVGMQLPSLNKLIEIRLLNFEEVPDLVGRKQIIHCIIFNR